MFWLPQSWVCIRDPARCFRRFIGSSELALGAIITVVAASTMTSLKIMNLAMSEDG